MGTFDGSRICSPLNLNGSATDVYFTGDFPGNNAAIVRLNVRDPSRPLFDGYWKVPMFSPFAAIAGSMVFEVTWNGTLKLFKLERADRKRPNWKELYSTYLKLMRRYGSLTGINSTRAESGVEAFEAAGIFNAIDAPVTTIPMEHAARLLTAYAKLLRLAHTSRVQLHVADSAMRRAKKIDASATL